MYTQREVDPPSRIFLPPGKEPLKQGRGLKASVAHLYLDFPRLPPPPREVGYQYTRYSVSIQDTNTRNMCDTEYLKFRKN